MADHIPGLNGLEIVNDFLHHIRVRLMRDCNLRESDNYTSGYSAKFSYQLEMYGIDKTVISETGAVKTPIDDPEKVLSEGSGEIPLEQNLTEVRDRSKQGDPEPVAAATGNTAGRRKYAKGLERAAVGGAVELE